MPYHFIAWYEALRPLGIRVSCFDVYSREGERWEKSMKDFLRRAEVKPSGRMLRKIFSLRQKIFRKYFKRTIFPGTEEFLVCLKHKGYPLGLVTGTPMQELKKILPTRIARLFEVVITGDRVKNGKPNPEPYVKAARLLSVKCGECVVVENAPLGIESAKRAGMFCVALTTSLPKGYLKRADVVVDRLEEITGLIETGCRVH
jgi:beta-phosphoglucomutase